MNLVELKKMKISELTNLAKEYNIEGASRMPKQDLVFALLQAQSAASTTSFARTGSNSTYCTAASRYGSSITNDANRPCHKWPRQPSRKLIIRVYRRWTSATA